MPSGHAAAAFVSGVFLYYLLKQSKYAGCRFLPLIYAFFITVYRVFVSAHYPSDVAGRHGYRHNGCVVFYFTIEGSGALTIPSSLARQDASLRKFCKWLKRNGSNDS
jgi:hypothetical protein